MKKILLLIFSLFIMAGLAFADVIPAYKDSIKYYGIGTLNMVNNFVVYDEPNEQSRVLKRVDYSTLENLSMYNVRSCIDNTLIAYIPQNKIALVAVDSNLETGWYEIIYDQSTGATGYVKQEDAQNFRTWKQTFEYWGKKNGIYLFKDVADDDKQMYSTDSKESQKLESFKYPRFITFSMIRGNWALVSVLDLEQRAKIGWIPWRTEEGRLLAFPFFSEQQ